MESCYFLAETDAAGAMDTSVHVCYDERAHVLVLDCAFVFVVAASSVSVEMGVVLEVAFATLVADGAVERVVGKKELHDTATGEAGGFGVSVNLHGWSDLGAAGSYWLWALLYLHKTHAAVSGYF